MTAAQYRDLALLIVGALAVALGALAAWYWREMDGYRRPFENADADRGLCVACRSKVVREDA